MIPDYTSNAIALLARPSPAGQQLGQIGQLLGQGIAAYGKNQQAEQAAMQKQQEEQEALILNRIIRSDDQQAMAIAQQAYDQGLFDDDDMNALFSFGAEGPTQAMTVDRMSAVDGIKALGYESLLPNEFRDGGSDKFGRLQAATDADGNPVFIQSSGSGEIREAEGYRPVTTAEKQKDITDALVERENVLNEKKNKIEKQEIDLLIKKLDLTQAQRMQGAKDREVQSQIDLGNTILSSDLDKIFGRGEKFYPELLRSQEGIDLKANVNQFVGQLKLAAAGKMKGQGSVSDNERKTLDEAATVLSNPNISPELARKSIQDAVLAIELTMDSNQAQAPQPRTRGNSSSSPAVIRFDAQGNMI